jgi:hypothetical protein
MDIFAHPFVGGLGLVDLGRAVVGHSQRAI